MAPPLVLTIQSHMTHGRSGNRSAVLPIEVNGIDCDPINTVNFSTHTAYPHIRGTKMTPQELEDILEGLRMNNILKMYTHLLTGYIGDPHIIKVIANLRKELGNGVHYLCDPVLGDSGELYVDPECKQLFKEVLVPIADTITPNQYEAEWLTDMKLNTPQDLLEIVKKLHELGPKNVAISSIEWKHRFVFFSFENGKIQLPVETKSYDRSFDGPGDVFAALLLSNMIKYPEDYEKVAKNTVNGTFCVIKNTFELGFRELAIPQSVEELIHPPELFQPITIEQFLKTNVNE
ncbi:pyridoxal kinase family protein [Trichomonas vaginalis G3]|uniref:pyridoxal kinase n=1 Tax=Trichomonas vaginalis (strain ATCC PRA-98 / G3) TaxID=412133 RepID=A2FGX0_TRIV3|nr:pyridoxal 5'-phosphate salvage [Trichomonas vaginalis G3]EAX95829.1 pyridoxal kinase family protein [Trichomonas vaginalis G3]KAI5494474.1 pyridoxal 5'-phosphate salvage [Trichomonas vaginalis G3]|eukprot:XP_001308759.1 pyridoxal kinase family protein [Trichomonas vaginalis G3]